MQGCTADTMIFGMFKHKLIIPLGCIILVEFVELDKLYQFIGILRISSISGSFKPLCPTPIVSDLQIKERCISLSASQESGVILIRLESGAICSETLIVCIIILIYLSTFPSVTLYSEVVITLHGKTTLTSTTLKESLSKSYRGRYLPTFHLFDGNILILVDILLVFLVPPHLGSRTYCHQKTAYNCQYCFLHIFHDCKINIYFPIK